MKNLEELKEPSHKDIEDYMKNNNLNFYVAREQLRESVYGKIPNGVSDWGTYWKCY